MYAEIVDSIKQTPLKDQAEKSVSITLKSSTCKNSVYYQKCDQCGTTSLVPTGSCFVCKNCGTSQGCG